jgi:hypothetical protein
MKIEINFKYIFTSTAIRALKKGVFLNAWQTSHDFLSVSSVPLCEETIKCLKPKLFVVKEPSPCKIFYFPTSPLQAAFPHFVWRHYLPSPFGRELY